MFNTLRLSWKWNNSCAKANESTTFLLSRFLTPIVLLIGRYQNAFDGTIRGAWTPSSMQKYSKTWCKSASTMTSCWWTFLSAHLFIRYRIQSNANKIRRKRSTGIVISLVNAIFELPESIMFSYNIYRDANYSCSSYNTLWQPQLQRNALL